MQRLVALALREPGQLPRIRERRLLRRLERVDRVLTDRARRTTRARPFGGERKVGACSTVGSFEAESAVCSFAAASVPACVRCALIPFAAAETGPIASSNMPPVPAAAAATRDWYWFVS
jgi:hypothetical protein